MSEDLAQYIWKKLVNDQQVNKKIRPRHSSSGFYFNVGDIRRYIKEWETPNYFDSEFEEDCRQLYGDNMPDFDESLK